ncbi:Acyltransferase mlcH [Hondaea fermentalgiana]|uniref:Acyltransferase mlcH n=1 Tax=Hondaea fermentalgiana TaxID=2315210 RepID=A0A2R5GDR9_9STRA|nr:Acyltransferase mlcH [Hondaea fermentalgiana]|eukprot:GBG28469.1 Acyltransferase mlcH [Hondaea fermentalgiana]
MHDYTGADVGLPWAERAETVGISSPALARLDAFLEHTVDEAVGHNFPMAGALIARHGKVVYYKGKGEALTEKGTPLVHDSIFRIYSMTKPITSLALLMLLEEGKLTLDQPAYLYLGPKWKKDNMRVLYKAGAETVPCERSITVRHLFTHMAGLSYGFEGLVPENPVDPLYQASARKAIKKNENLEELCDRIADLPLCCQPGEAWNYSLATDVLGRIVEVISGQSLADFFQERIFGPLDMRDTAFQLDETKYARLVSLHLEQPDTSKVDMTHLHVKHGEYTNRKRMYSGGGGLVSTFRDYARFAQFCLNQGELDGKRLLGRKTFELAVRNHLPANKDITQLSTPSCSDYAYPGLGFGLGFAVQMNPALSSTQTTEGQFYWSGAASTTFFCDPKEDMFAMFFTQVFGRDDVKMPLHTYFRNIVYGTLIDSTKPSSAVSASRL